MRIVFFGTPQLAATILNYLSQQPVDIAAVVSRPDKPKGRSGQPQPTAVKLAAQALALPVYQPLKASDPEFVEMLRALDADLFVVAAYAEILRENVLELPRLGCLNVHGSLLPKYRGAAPIQRAVMAGERETGVSIMQMVLEMDAGDVYAVEKIAIPEEMTTGELFDRMAYVGAKLLWEVMSKLESGKIKAAPQDHTQATFAKKIKASDREVVWDRPACEIHNQIRGLTPNPGAWCWVEIRGVKKRLSLKKARSLDVHSGAPGELVDDPARLIVNCGEGALELLEVQIEGKKSLPADLFLRGVQADNLKF